MRARLDTDDDGHWYIVPVGLEDDFDVYVNNPDEMNFPKGVIEVNGHPNLVTFENWSIA